jgi:hypothetical protein
MIKERKQPAGVMAGKCRHNTDNVGNTAPQLLDFKPPSRRVIPVGHAPRLGVRNITIERLNTIY